MVTADIDKLIREAIELSSADPMLAEMVDDLQSSEFFYTFVPRPDDPVNFDQQHSFCFNRDPVSFLIGGNAAGCLGAEQEVFDPVRNEYRRVSEIGEPFHVWSLNKITGEIEVGQALKPKIYGVADLYEVTLSNGQSFIATAGHRLLSAAHTWSQVSSCAAESRVPLQSAPVELSRASFEQYESRCRHTVQDCPGGYLPGYRLCGGQLPLELDSGLTFLPSQGGAFEHSPTLLRADDQVATLKRRGHRNGPHHSNYRFARLAHRLASVRNQIALELCSQSFGRGDIRGQDSLASSLAIHRQIANQRFLEESFRSDIDQSSSQAAKEILHAACQSPHGVLESTYVTKIRFLRRDVYWDFTVFPHHNYLLAGIVHSNTTEASAYKCARFVLCDQPPPRKDTPFWIIANTYEQVCDVCWSEKLLGHGHIPECEIEWDRIAWISAKEGRPKSVPLKPWPESRGGHPGKNWRLEFKSYEQGRAAMQARSIGGFWFSEQFPLDIFLEVLRGCREYMFPGGQFCEFTPIDPELSLWVEKAMENQPPGWKFYRANTFKNKGNLQEGWFEQFFSLVPDEMQATRMTGALASFEGIIYPSFNQLVHVVDESLVRIPPGAYHAFATDWGASAEHPHASVFGCRDTIGNWLIYDEYWSPDQFKITRDHAAAVLDKLVEWGWPIQIKYKPNGKIVRRMNPRRDALWGSNHADPARPGEIREFQKRGIDTVAARNQVYEGINTVRTALKTNPVTGRPKLIISSKCKRLIEELRKYRWKRGKSPTSGNILNPQVARPEPLKRDDDVADALRYLLNSNEIDFSETIQSTAKNSHATDRRSVQLFQSKLERATRGALPGLIPNRG